MDRAIRRLTREEQEQAAYAALCEEIEAEMRAEYEAQFGPEYRAQHPFNPGNEVHNRAMAEIEARRHNEN